MKKYSAGFIAVSLLCSVLLSGCSFSNTGGSYHPKLYTSGSKAKGVVAMLPVYSKLGYIEGGLPWNLQKEFTEEISRRLYESDKVYLIKHNASSNIVSHFYNPSADILPNSLATHFLPAEFVVATELLEQVEESDNLGNDTVTASVRIKVFDIRKNKISLIYQEIIEAKQPVILATNDYHRYGWKSKHFDSTPMGLMHNRLFREIVARVEGYVCANYA